MNRETATVIKNNLFVYFYQTKCEPWFINKTLYFTLTCHDVYLSLLTSIP